MRKTLSTLICFAALVLCSQTVALGAPKADCSAPHYDAGQIEQGAMIVHEFTFLNTGDEPLILKVNDCGCGGLQFKAPAQPIKPGQKGAVTVSIPTINRRGAYRREIMVGTNDPAHKEIRLSVTARIFETFSIAPQYIDFGRVKQGSIDTREIAISNTGREPFTITDVAVNPAGVVATAPGLKMTTLKPGEKRTIKVALAPSARTGPIEARITILTDRRAIPEKIIFVRAETGKD